MAISIQVDAANATNALLSMANSVRDRTLPNRQLSAQLYSWTITNYDQRGARRPDGAWAPLAPRTVKEKIRLGYRPEPLAPRTGNLRMSFLGFSDNDTAGIGARASYGVDYAEVHERGSREKNIPARPMLPPQDIAVGYALRIYDRFVAGAKKDAGL